MKVCEKVQKKGVTTYNEVADELVAEFSSSDNHMSPNDAVSAADQRGPRPGVWPVLTPCVSLKHVYDQKNIRRRVYDALNVLMAMNIISKEKKEIKWIGLPTNSAQECQNLEVRPPPVLVERSYSQSSNSQRRLCRQVERQRRLERIKQKQSQLQELILQVSGGVPGRSRTGAPRPQLRRFTSTRPPSCSAANSV